MRLRKRELRSATGKRTTGAVIAAMMVVSCSGARVPPPTSRSNTTSHTRDKRVDCRENTAASMRLQAAIQEGNWLGARTAFERVTRACDSMPHTLPVELSTKFAAASTAPSALIERARAWRASNQIANARSAEAAAVGALETAHHVRLSLSPRFGVRDLKITRDRRHLVSVADGMATILDGRTGDVVYRASGRSVGDDLEVSPRGDRVYGWPVSPEPLAPTASAPAVSATPCPALLAVHDTASGRLLANYCHYAWKLSSDGSRLVVIEYPSEQLTLIDTQKLETVARIEPPPGVDGRGQLVYADDFLKLSPNGRSLLVHWSQGFKLVDLVTGKDKTISAPNSSEHTFSPDSSRIAWFQDNRLVVWNVAERRAIEAQAPGCNNIVWSGRENWLATACGRFVELWDGSALRRLARVSTTDELPEIRGWIHGNRAVVVRLGILSGTGKADVVLDARTHQWLHLEALLSRRPERHGVALRGVEFAPDTPIATIEWQRGHADLIYLDSDLKPISLSGPGCGFAHDTIISNGTTAVTLCERGRLFWIDLETGKTRVGPTAGGEPYLIVDQVLVTVGDGDVVLHDLATGERLASSPKSPLEIAGAFWAGADIVVESAIPHAAGIGSVRQLRTTLQSTLHVSASVPQNSCTNGRAHARGRTLVSAGETEFTFCDRATGQVRGKVRDKVELVGTMQIEPSFDGAYALVEDAIGKMSLQALNTGKQMPLNPTPRFGVFGDADTIVGFDNDNQCVVWSAFKGQRIALWQTGNIQALPTATSRSLGIAVVTKEPAVSGEVELRDLMSGEIVGHLPSKGTGDAGFGPNEILLVAESDRVSLWKVPDALRLGDLYFHPNRDAAALLTPSGEFETSSDIAEWQQFLRCQVGPVELPLHVCVDAYYTPGIGRTLLSSPTGGGLNRG